MKAHKYWSVGALITMIGTFYTGYKGLKAAHKYFAFGLIFFILCLSKVMDGMYNIVHNPEIFILEKV